MSAPHRARVKYFGRAPNIFGRASNTLGPRSADADAGGQEHGSASQSPEPPPATTRIITRSSATPPATAALGGGAAPSSFRSVPSVALPNSVSVSAGGGAEGSEGSVYSGTTMGFSEAAMGGQA